MLEEPREDGKDGPARDQPQKRGPDQEEGPGGSALRSPVGQLDQHGADERHRGHPGDLRFRRGRAVGHGASRRLRRVSAERRKRHHNAGGPTRLVTSRHRRGTRSWRASPTDVAAFGAMVVGRVIEAAWRRSPWRSPHSGGRAHRPATDGPGRLRERQGSDGKRASAIHVLSGKRRCPCRHSRVDARGRSTRGRSGAGFSSCLRRSRGGQAEGAGDATPPHDQATGGPRGWIARVTAAQQGRIGVAVIGLGGAVATTAVAGVEQMRLGSSTTAGLPFAHRDDLVPYESLVFGGWDLDADDLAKAAHVHRVLEPAQIEAVAEQMERIRPWPAVADPAWCRNATGTNVVGIGPLRERVAHVRGGPAPLPGERGARPRRRGQPRLDRGVAGPDARRCSPTSTRSRRGSTPTRP